MTGGRILAGREQLFLKIVFFSVALLLGIEVGQGMDPSRYFVLVYGIVLVTMIIFLPLERVLLCAVFVLPVIPNYFDIYLAPSLPYISLQKVTLSALTIYWVSTKIIRREKIIVGPSFKKWLLICAFLQALSLITSVQVKLSVFAYSRYWLENYLLFFMVIDLIRGEKAMLRVYNALILSGVVVSAIGLFHYFSGKYPLDFVPSASLSDSLWMYYQYDNVRLGIRRINSVFTHTIILGMFLNMIIPALLIFVISKYFRARRNMYIVALTILSASLVLTLSRAAWAGTIALLTIVLWFLEGRQWRYLPLVPVILGGILMFLGGDRFFPAAGAIFFSAFRVLGLETTSAFHVKGLSQLSNSTLDRGPAILSAWSKVLSRPILGYGVTGNDLSVIGNDGDIFYFLKIAMDSGVISLVALLIFFGSIMCGLYKSARGLDSSTRRALTVICLASVVGYLVTLQGATFPDVSFLFWIICGMSVNLIWEKREGDFAGGGDEGC